MLVVKVDVNVKLLEGAPSTSTAVASRRVLAVVCVVSRRHTYSLRLISISRVSFTGGGGDGGAGGGGGVGERALTTPTKQSVPNLDLASAQLTVVNVPVVGDDLLNDGRADFWFWSWRWRWGRRRWRRRRGRSTLFLASDDDLVSYDFAVVLRRGFCAGATDDKLLALASNQLAAVACWRWKTPFAASDCQGTPFSAGVPTITAEFSAVCTNLKVAVFFLEADRASLSRHVAAMATDLAARSADVDVVASAASETHFVIIHLTWGRSADGSDRGPITTAEDDVITLGGTARLLAASDCDVVALNLAH